MLRAAAARMAEDVCRENVVDASRRGINNWSAAVLGPIVRIGQNGLSGQPRLSGIHATAQVDVVGSDVGAMEATSDKSEERAV